MAHENFVTYEQVVKLKELGFDWECDYLYDVDKELTKYDYQQEFYDEELYSNCILAPTLAQTQKWLREVKKIETNAFMDFNGETPNNKWIWLMREFSDFLFATDSSKGESEYFTYEEALSAGIDKALELLKQQNK